MVSAGNTSIKTTCPYCGVGCGVTATFGLGETSVDGDESHPANFGKLCSKGYALPDTLYDENRLLQPSIDNKLVSWDDAVTRISSEFQSVIDQYGAEAIAFYVSGQLLTEDYYAVNKFVKGYLGTANIDTNSRLCMASSVAGHKRAFGSDTVPGCYEDLELADVVVLVGSNLAWCHPVLFQRIQSAKDANPAMKVIVVDPRKTASADLCDVHLPIKAGGESDAVLFLGLLHYLSQEARLDREWVELHTNNVEEALTAAEHWTVENVAEFTSLSVAHVKDFYQLFAVHEKVVTVYSQGVNQSHRGTDTVNSIINVHLATGRIGKEGCGPFSITGQPNAMGGREVGGLANMLACHMDVENEVHQKLVQRYWGSPAIAKQQGLKAVDLFKAVKSGKIKALWIMATNPADSMPNANDVAEAIAECPFVVVSDVTGKTDTVKLATVALPARAWSEKDGTVTNSERRISRQRAFRLAPTGARPDWWAVSKVAQHMGYHDAFNYRCVSDIFREYAGLSGYENFGTRDFDISALEGITQAEYDALNPFQWPKKAGAKSDSKRFFSNGKFFTDDRKARFVPIIVRTAEKDNSDRDDFVVSENKENAARLKSSVHHFKSNGYSSSTFVLNTGRIRDQWHTMTRTGFSQRLSSHLGEPFIEIHPEDASAMDVAEASIIDVASEYGSIQVRALITDRVRPGTVFIPMHWTDEYASNARVNALVHSRHDPVSGQPALKNQQVNLRVSDINSFGFMVSRKRPNTQIFDYWATTPIEQGWKTEFASVLTSALLIRAIHDNCAESMVGADLTEYADKKKSQYRSAWFAGKQLHKAVYLSRSPVLVARSSVCSLLTHDFDIDKERLMVVSGAGLSSIEDTGATICSCMQVGSKTIQSAIDAGCDSIQRVGEQCGAGTQCGSCRSDIVRNLSVTLPKIVEQIEELSA